MSHALLLVDDEEGILNALVRLLRREGYRLHTARSGPEALRILEQTPIHLVLADQRMPGMTGVELMKEIKARYPDVIRIVLSGYADVDTITQAVNEGEVYRFLTKPWDDETLKVTLRQSLHQYDLIQENRSLTERLRQANEKLQALNQELEQKAQARAEELLVKNRVLQVSQEILENLPIGVVGAGPDGTIVLANRAVSRILDRPEGLYGQRLEEVFTAAVAQMAAEAAATRTPSSLSAVPVNGVTVNLECHPIGLSSEGRGVVLMVYPGIGGRR